MKIKPRDMRTLEKVISMVERLQRKVIEPNVRTNVSDAKDALIRAYNHAQ